MRVGHEEALVRHGLTCCGRHRERFPDVPDALDHVWHRPSARVRTHSDQAGGVG